MPARVVCLLLASALLFACSSSGSSSGSPSTVNTSEVCAKVATLPCSSYTSQADCQNELEAARQSAQQTGCSSQYEAAVQCTVDHPPTCSATGTLTTDPECQQAALAYAQCDPSVVCTHQSTTGSCSYSCSASAMSCEQQTTDWTCTCTKGPLQNQSFTSTESDPCTRPLLKASCE